jgi:nicotinate-nucleotide adenylyltransferase
VAAVNARHALALDRLLLVVANEPWQKVGSRALTPAADRLALTAAAVADVPGLEASSIEIDRGGRSYTADTVADLAAAYAGAELFCVVGADVAGQLNTWERVEEVRMAAILVVVNRPGAARPTGLSGWRVEHVEVPALDISSSDLRARVADGRPLDFLIPDASIRCIRQRGLYADRR